jgi:hypothetical protein
MMIEKKRFMGDKSLRSYVIPMGTKEIGDWAFAGCRELAWIKIPASVTHVGRDAFAGCDKLMHASWYQERPEEEDELSGLMAVALRFFKADERLITGRRLDRQAWLTLWDEACEAFLRSSDAEGFRPFLAGGEEDYADEEEKLKEHCRATRLRKALAVYVRLTADGNPERKPYYQKMLRENDVALELLINHPENPAKAVNVFGEAGFLTQENCRELLRRVPEECVELKALLLQRAAQGGAGFSLDYI